MKEEERERKKKERKKKRKESNEAGREGEGEGRRGIGREREEDFVGVCKATRGKVAMGQEREREKKKREKGEKRVKGKQGGRRGERANEIKISPHAPCRFSPFLAPGSILSPKTPPNAPKPTHPTHSHSQTHAHKPSTTRILLTGLLISTQAGREERRHREG